MKHYSYLAWMQDNTLKVGYALDPFFRVKRGLTSSSNCFLCFRIEHASKQEAKEQETWLKKFLEPFRIKNAHCKEWFHSNQKGIKKAIITALKYSPIEWAAGIGNKHSTTWENASLEEMKKIIKKLE
mgnify:CR=1 FL=1